MPRVTINSIVPNPASPHPREVQALFRLVDWFAEEMKARLLQKYPRGTAGWRDPALKDYFNTMISMKAAESPLDPVDLANWVMFCWNLEVPGAKGQASGASKD